MIHRIEGLDNDHHAGFFTKRSDSLERSGVVLDLIFLGNPFDPLLSHHCHLLGAQFRGDGQGLFDPGFEFVVVVPRGDRRSLGHDVGHLHLELLALSHDRVDVFALIGPELDHIEPVRVRLLDLLKPWSLRKAPYSIAMLAENLVFTSEKANSSAARGAIKEVKTSAARRGNWIGDFWIFIQCTFLKRLKKAISAPNSISSSSRMTLDYFQTWRASFRADRFTWKFSLGKRLVLPTTLPVDN